MFKVIMIVDNVKYVYGTYSSQDKANEIALFVREQRNIDTYVIEA